jgi:hypothetical protein
LGFIDLLKDTNRLSRRPVLYVPYPALCGAAVPAGFGRSKADVLKFFGGKMVTVVIDL